MEQAEIIIGPRPNLTLLVEPVIYYWGFKEGGEQWPTTTGSELNGPGAHPPV
jgi:hypothetical protein